MIHDLKTWPGMFANVAAGHKTHEIRKMDRPFMIGDVLRLREWDPYAAEYTGHVIDVTVTFVTCGGEWGIPADLCVMSIRRVPT